MRVFRGILWCATFLLAVTVVGVFALSTQNLKFAAPYLEKTLSQHLGQPITIGGPIRAALLPEGLRLAIDDVSVENVSWGLEPRAGKVQHIVMDVKVRPLLEQRVELDRLRISGATLFVERNEDGAVNWSALASDGPGAMSINQMDFERIQVQFYDLSKSGLTRLAVRELSVAPTDKGVSYDGLFQVAGQPLSFSGHTDGMAGWAEGEVARTQNQLVFAGYKFEIFGDLADPRQASSELAVAGTTPEGAAMPAVFGFAEDRQAISARLLVGKNWLELDDLVLGTTRRGPQAGISLDWTPFERPFLEASVRATTMELKTLGAGWSSAEEEGAFAQSVELVSRILRNWDGRVTLDVDRMRLAGTHMQDFEIDIRSEGGRIVESGLSTFVAGGYVEVPVQVWFEPYLSVALQPTVKNVWLERLNDLEGSRLPFSGVLNLAAELKGEGDTPADLLASLEGQTNLLLGDGVMVPRADLSFAAESWAEVWQLFRYGRWDRDEPGEPMALSCVVSRFDFDGGLAMANGFLVETNQAATTGAGYVDLREGRIDFRLSPRPKDPALLASASDLRVAGGIGAPTLTPERNPPAERRGSGGVGTLVLSGGAQSILPLMEIGHDNENVCIRQISGSVSEASGLNGALGNGG